MVHSVCYVPRKKKESFVPFYDVVLVLCGPMEPRHWIKQKKETTRLFLLLISAAVFTVQCHHYSCVISPDTVYA